jgi:SAM-dependent methyltransferase
MKNNTYKGKWKLKDGDLFESRIRQVEEEDAEFYYSFFEKRGLLENVTSWFGLGAGAGALELIVTSNLNVEIGFLDPSENLVSLFNKRINSAALNHRVREIHCDYFQDIKLEKSYDLIVSLHSWYYIGLNADLLQKALDGLMPQGKLIIIVIHPDSFIADFIREYRTNQNSENPITSDQISNWANSLGFKHKYLEEIHQVTKERYINNNQLTLNGKNFVSYTSRMDWNSITPDIQKEIFSFLEKNIVNDCFQFKFGLLIFDKS